MENGDIRGRLKEKGRPSVEEARSIMRQILSALHYLDSFSIAHQDMCLRNLFYRETESGVEVKVGDFGSSRSYASGFEMNSDIVICSVILKDLVHTTGGHAKDLVESMMESNENDRFAARDALSHVWFQG